MNEQSDTAKEAVESIIERTRAAFQIEQVSVMYQVALRSEMRTIRYCRLTAYLAIAEDGDGGTTSTAYDNVGGRAGS